MSDKLETNHDAYMAGGPLSLSGGSYYQRLKWDGKHRDDLKNCTDCKHMVGHVNWWCKSRKAEIHYGTSIPGRDDCKFWSPCAKDKPPLYVRVANLFKKNK